MRFLAGFLILALPALAELSAEQKQLNIDSFEKVWTTVRDKHWEKKPGCLDWQAIHEAFHSRIDQAKTTDEARAFTREMLARLKQTHFGVFAASVDNEVYSEGRCDGAT